LAAVLHVAAKRYLCAVEPGYTGRLSPASVYTLGVQGGPMSAAETAGFEALLYGQEACQVGRSDDDAKDPDAPTPTFAQFEPLLRGLAG
jgi:gamma-butyrobetaine dioxygenase